MRYAQQVIILSIIVSLGLAVFVYLYNPEQDLRVNFLDIGQGGGILIQTPYDQNILIDGGDTDGKVLRQLPKFMPFWDREIGLMILTHPHDDHVGGLARVVKRYKVEKILYTGAVHNAPAYLAWLSVARDKHIPVTIIDRPQTIALGENLEIEILYPFESLLNKEVDNLNNSSIVVKLVYGENSFLFTGDAEGEVERKLLAAGINLSADVLKAGHHGSDTSSSEEFLAAVKQRYAVIQVGEDNDFGHPSLRVLKRFERIGAEVYRNDLDGWVQVISDGKSIEVKSEK